MDMINKIKKMQCEAFQKNKLKNRYADVKCAEESRVVLKDKISDCDYIHASYVQLYKGESVICTQGPMKNTCVDFWRMMWQEKSDEIVMLCLLTENKVEKCYRYYPEQLEETSKYGPFTVKTKKIERKEMDKGAYLTVRLFALTYQDESRSITHVIYEQWPDKGRPNDARTVMKLLVGPCIVTRV